MENYISIHIVGIEALSKLLDALTTNQAHQFIVVRTDEFQSQQPSKERGFIVEIYDITEYYIEAWDNNDKTYTLEEVREVLQIDPDNVDE